MRGIGFLRNQAYPIITASYALLFLCVSSVSQAEPKYDRVRHGPPSMASLEGWSIKANKPVYIDDDLIIGTYMLKKMSGDATTRGGGACLVADLNDKYPCDTREDCLEAQENGDVKATPPGGYIYCEALNGQKHKRCWTRPSADGCTRSPGRVPGVYETGPAHALVDGEPVVWTTLACLAIEENNFGCGSEDPTQHLYVSSPPLYSGEEGDGDLD